MDQNPDYQPPLQSETTAQVREAFKREFGDDHAVHVVAGYVEQAIFEWASMPRSREGSIIRTKLEEAAHRLRDLVEAGEPEE